MTNEEIQRNIDDLNRKREEAIRLGRAQSIISGYDTAIQSYQNLLNNSQNTLNNNTSSNNTINVNINEKVLDVNDDAEYKIEKPFASDMFEKINIKGAGKFLLIHRQSPYKAYFYNTIFDKAITEGQNAGLVNFKQTKEILGHAIILFPRILQTVPLKGTLANVNVSEFAVQLGSETTAPIGTINLSIDVFITNPQKYITISGAKLTGNLEPLKRLFKSEIPNMIREKLKNHDYILQNRADGKIYKDRYQLINAELIDSKNEILTKKEIEQIENEYGVTVKVYTTGKINPYGLDEKAFKKAKQAELDKEIANTEAQAKIAKYDAEKSTIQSQTELREQQTVAQNYIRKMNTIADAEMLKISEQAKAEATQNRMNIIGRDVYLTEEITHGNQTTFVENPFKHLNNMQSQPTQQQAQATQQIQPTQQQAQTTQQQAQTTQQQAQATQQIQPTQQQTQTAQQPQNNQNLQKMEQYLTSICNNINNMTDEEIIKYLKDLEKIYNTSNKVDIYGIVNGKNKILFHDTKNKLDVECILRSINPNQNNTKTK